MFVPATPTATPTLATAPLPLAPLATVFSPGRVQELRRRDGAADSLSQVDSCYARVASLSCDAPYLDCLESIDSQWLTVTNYNTGIASSEQLDLEDCYCTYGMPYLSCYFSALTQSDCSTYFESFDFSSYASFWFGDYCGTVPASLFADAGPTTPVNQKQMPSTVNLDFESVTTTTLTSTPPPPTYTYTPLFASTANLLVGDCASTRFNLLEDIGTVYWAAYAGCGTDMPQCCPWTASSTALQGMTTVPASGSATTTTAAPTTTPTTTTPTTNAFANNVFPVPADQHQATLRRCPADYTVISGQCCPSSYWPFTRALGGQTPCYSSLAVTTEPPTLTVGLIGQPTATQKPTSAVVNVVWAMSYPAAGHGGARAGLSRGAIAGIVIGSIIGFALLVDVAVYTVWQWKRSGHVRPFAGWVQPRPWWPSRGAKQAQSQPQPWPAREAKQPQPQPPQPPEVQPQFPQEQPQFLQQQPQYLQEQPQYLQQQPQYLQEQPQYLQEQPQYLQQQPQFPQQQQAPPPHYSSAT